MVRSSGAVAVEFRDVPQLNCFSMLLSIYKYQLKQSFLHEYQI